MSAESERGTDTEPQIFHAGRQLSNSGGNLLDVQPTNNLKASSSNFRWPLKPHLVTLSKLQEPPGRDGVQQKGHSHTASLQRRVGEVQRTRTIQRQEVSWGWARPWGPADTGSPSRS